MIRLNFLCACTALVFLAGCIRYNEDVSVDQNGKGKATLVMSRPKMGIIDKLKNSKQEEIFSPESMKKELPAGVTCDVTRTEKDERVEVTAVYAFNDITAFITWAARTELPVNNISIRRDTENLEYTRRFAPPTKSEQEEFIKKYGIDVPVVFKFTGPGTLVSHNGTRAEGNTITWEMKLPELYEGTGKVFTAQYFFGTPKWVYAAGALAVIVLIAAVAMVLRKKPAA